MIDWARVGRLSWTSYRDLPIHHIRPVRRRAASRWAAALFLGHPGRHLEDLETLLTAAAGPLHLCLYVNTLQESESTPDLINTIHQIAAAETIAVIAISSHSSVIIHTLEIRGGGDGALATITVFIDY